jgi:hypothetical protein
MAYKNDNARMLSVSEVFELQPGNDQEATWINPGFEAEVRKIVSTKIKSSGKPMHICTLGDPTCGAEVSMTVFTNQPGFQEGDTIEVFGKGLRRTEYNGLAQVSIGKDTEIHVKRIASQAAAPRQQARPPAPAAPRDDTRGGGGGPAAPAPAPHTGGAQFNGQTVGMAVKAAVDILIHNAATGKLVAAKDGALELHAQPVILDRLQGDVAQIAMMLIVASKRLELGLVRVQEPAEDVPY